MSGGLWPYVALIAAGFLPSEVWRWFAIVLARGLDERSEIVRFAAVAVGFAAFLALRRSVLAGVLAGEAVLVGVSLVWR